MRSGKYTVTARRLAALLLICTMPLLLFACSEKTEKETTMPATFYDGPNPIVTFEMEDGSIIKAELYPAKAPNTVKNFISLVSSGYYDGKVFHRAVADFMIQGGSSDGTSSGQFPYCIPGEFTNNGFAQNDIKHTPGVLSMARAGAPYGVDPKPYNNSASSQFFIVDGDRAAGLNGDYAAFGKVIEGLDVVHRIARSPASGEMLVNPVKMVKVTVDTLGGTFDEPVTLPPLR